MDRSFARNFFRRETSVRAFKVAIVVGPVLIAINQLDLILNRDFSYTLLLKSFLTFLVPYCVSAYSSARAYGESG